MRIDVKSIILVFLMLVVSLSVATNSLNGEIETPTFVETSDPLNVILPLSQLNEPGFQEGSIYTNTTLSAGNSHSCAIIDNGSIACWGRGSDGQLGDGTIANRWTPTLTNSQGLDRTATAIAAGGAHTCAILDNGLVSCWGHSGGSDGRLGNGDTSDKTSPTLTSSFGNGRTAIEISAGAGHTCVILDNFSVSCWGNNDYGQIGDGTTNSRLTPTPVIGFENNSIVIGISSGTHHTCAIVENGSVYCWGYGVFGRLGNGDSSDKTSPTLTSSFSDGRTAISISSGGFHSCALLDDGNVSCWGWNPDGQVGINEDSTSGHVVSNPSSINIFDDGATAVAISLGASHSCAILDNGLVNCWGLNDFGQLGDGTSVNRYEPVLTQSLGSEGFAIGISAGAYHTCALLDTGDVSCWGMGYLGRLGDNQNEDRAFPNPTSSFPDERKVAVSERDTDGDNVLNIFDEFPNNSTESSDADDDGIGDNSDMFPNDPSESSDYDGDGVGDNSDMFPNNPNEWSDIDGDGVGDNGDEYPNNEFESKDSDGDGVGDNSDMFPNNPNEWWDIDGDGVGDNSDMLPSDPNEWSDLDADGVGDNSDLCPNTTNFNGLNQNGCSLYDLDYDSDGVYDFEDICPNTVPSNVDENGCAAYQLDSDGDGITNDIDMFPYNDNETTDSDYDGVGDNSDTCPNTLFLGQINSDGCATYQIDIDSDSDGIFDYLDDCPDSNSYDYVNETGCVRLITDVDSNQSGNLNRNDAKEHIVIIEKNGYESDLLLSKIDEPIVIWIDNITGINGTRNHPIDVYIVTTDQKYNHFCGGEGNQFAKEFSPLYSAEDLHPNQLPYQITFTPTSDDSLWLIIDNCDNQRLSDWGTGGTRDLSQIQVTYSVDDRTDEVSEAIAKGIFAIIGGGLLLFCGLPLLLASTIIFLLVRNRRSTKKLHKKLEEKFSEERVSEEFSLEAKTQTSTKSPSKRKPSTKSGPRPSKDASGAIGDDGYEWITFPPNSQNHFYRETGESEWQNFED